MLPAQIQEFLPDTEKGLFDEVEGGITMEPDLDNVTLTPRFILTGKIRATIYNPEDKDPSAFEVALNKLEASVKRGFCYRVGPCFDGRIVVEVWAERVVY